MPNKRTGPDYLDQKAKKKKKKKRVNPFEGQKIMVNGKLEDRTPANSPGGGP